MAQGTYKFPANFEVTIQELLDPRGGVDKLADLINPNTFPHDGDTVYMKEGMVVSVRETCQMFMLKDLANIYAEDYSGWEIVGGSNSGTGGALIIDTDLDFNTVASEQLTTGQLTGHNATFKQIKMFVQKCGIIILRQTDGKVCYCTRAELPIGGLSVMLHFVKDFGYVQYEIALLVLPNNAITYTVNRQSFRPDTELSDSSEQPVQNKVVADALSKKVDKEDGKGLSTEDFTTVLKEKLESLGNYDDSEISEAVDSLQEQFDALVKGNASKAIESFNEVIAFLENIQDDVTLEGVIAAIQLEIAGKQDELSEEDFVKINGKSVFGKGEISVDVYESEIENPRLEVVETYGDIIKGTALADINGKTYNQLFDAILFPTVVPDITYPKATIAFSNYSNLQVVGAPAPKEYNFSKSFSSGAISVNGKVQGHTTGGLDGDASYMYYNGKPSQNVLPEVVPFGSTTYTWRAHYHGGDQPMTNKGEPWGTAFQAGNIDSNALTVVGTYPYYATTSGATDGVPIQQPLLHWVGIAVTTPEFTLLPTSTCKQVISTPSEIKEIYAKDASGNFILTDLDEFTKTTETRNGRTYYKYEYNGKARGSVTLKIKF